MPADPLANTTFDSLDAMMQAYAKEAVRTASREYDVQLDYSIVSIPLLERILDQVASRVEADTGFETKLWGSYFGEVFRRQYASEWSMSVYPGGNFSVPTVEIAESRIYPLMKVNRRLTMGTSESLVSFSEMVEKRLGHKRPHFD